jgi:hypothetical protein
MEDDLPALARRAVRDFVGQNYRNGPLICINDLDLVGAGHHQVFTCGKGLFSDREMEWDLCHEDVLLGMSQSGAQRNRNDQQETYNGQSPSVHGGFSFFRPCRSTCATGVGRSSQPMCTLSCVGHGQNNGWLVVYGRNECGQLIR